MRGTGAIPFPKTLRPTETAILHLLKSPLVKQQFTSSFLTESRTAFDTLLRVRNEMHLQSKALHDTLEFSLQPRIASQTHPVRVADDQGHGWQDEQQGGAVAAILRARPRTAAKGCVDSGVIALWKLPDAR